MTPSEVELVRRELAAANARAAAAEQRAASAERQCDMLRSLLVRAKTSLAEPTNFDAGAQRAA